MDLDFSKLESVKTGAQADFSPEPKPSATPKALHDYRAYTEITEALPRIWELTDSFIAGVEEAEPATLLLLQAVKILRLVTPSYNLIPPDLEETIKAVYGEGLRDEALLGEMVADVENRIRTLKSTASRRDIRIDTKERLEDAIAECQNRLQYLQGLRSERGL